MPFTSVPKLSLKHSVLIEKFGKQNSGKSTPKIEACKKAHLARVLKTIH